jgi:hypothetical protein
MSECKLCGQEEHADPKHCPCRCSACGAEKDSNGWCPSYCDDYDPVMDDVPYADVWKAVPS